MMNYQQPGEQPTRAAIRSQTAPPSSEPAGQDALRELIAVQQETLEVQRKILAEQERISADSNKVNDRIEKIYHYLGPVAFLAWVSIAGGAIWFFIAMINN